MVFKNLEQQDFNKHFLNDKQKCFLVLLLLLTQFVGLYFYLKPLIFFVKFLYESVFIVLYLNVC